VLGCGSEVVNRKRKKKGVSEVVCVCVCVVVVVVDLMEALGRLVETVSLRYLSNVAT